MSISIGYAGASARRNWFIDLVVPSFVFFVVFLVLAPGFMILATRIGPLPVIAEIAVGVIVGLLIWRKQYSEMFSAMRGASNWAKGANGEALAASALACLPDSYVVFHDFHPRVGDITADWNLDHVVIGPNGVFIVETKNYSHRTVRPAFANRYTRKNVDQVRRNAVAFKIRLKAWSREALADLFVLPLLVYVQPGAYVEKTREEDVHVIPLKWLANEIERHSSSRQLDLDEIYRIASVMFHQMEPHLMEEFRPALDRFGAESRRFKLERAHARANAPEVAPAPEQTAAPAESAPMPRAPEGFPSTIPSTCPNCGAKLQRHVARQGYRSGKPFLGCPNYRTGCSFIYNLTA